jgi:hypothetical protein
MREVPELKILPHQLIFGSFGHFFSLGNQRFENVSILSQRMINPPDKIGGVRILLIIIGISTRIITEFLVNSPPHWSVAVKTVFLGWYHF